jgi:hypothetical protein
MKEKDFAKMVMYASKPLDKKMITQLVEQQSAGKSMSVPAYRMTKTLKSRMANVQLFEVEKQLPELCRHAFVLPSGEGEFRLSYPVYYFNEDAFTEAMLEEILKKLKQTWEDPDTGCTYMEIGRETYMGHTIIYYENYPRQAGCPKYFYRVI